jgi:hypothetical protein
MSTLTALPKNIVHAFIDGWKSASGSDADSLHLSGKRAKKQEKELRDNLTEKEIDKMVADSFPASDPPSSY